MHVASGHHNLRYKYDMVDVSILLKNHSNLTTQQVMMDLIGEAKSLSTESGCAPSWIQFLSDADVPIVPCSVLRNVLCLA